MHVTSHIHHHHLIHITCHCYHAGHSPVYIIAVVSTRLWTHVHTVHCVNVVTVVGSVCMGVFLECTSVCDVHGLGHTVQLLQMNEVRLYLPVCTSRHEM